MHDEARAPHRATLHVLEGTSHTNRQIRVAIGSGGYAFIYFFKQKGAYE
jgi:hypothetical protein